MLMHVNGCEGCVVQHRILSKAQVYFCDDNHVKLVTSQLQVVSELRGIGKGVASAMFVVATAAAAERPRSAVIQSGVLAGVVMVTLRMRRRVSKVVSHWQTTVRKNPDHLRGLTVRGAG